MVNIDIIRETNISDGITNSLISPQIIGKWESDLPNNSSSKPIYITRNMISIYGEISDNNKNIYLKMPTTKNGSSQFFVGIITIGISGERKVISNVQVHVLDNNGNETSKFNFNCPVDYVGKHRKHIYYVSGYDGAAVEIGSIII